LSDKQKPNSEILADYWSEPVPTAEDVNLLLEEIFEQNGMLITALSGTFSVGRFAEFEVSGIFRGSIPANVEEWLNDTFSPHGILFQNFSYTTNQNIQEFRLGSGRTSVSPGLISVEFEGRFVWSARNRNL
jgi:hypothetical protein